MKNIQKDIRKLLVDRGWDQLRPSDIAKSISIEAAELLENFQWSSQTIEDTKKNKVQMKKVELELADVLIYCLDMAVLLDLDAEKLIRNKLKLIAKKYPAKKVKTKKGPDAGTDETYWRIKDNYRRNGLS